MRLAISLNVPSQAALGRGAVVADDVHHERVVEFAGRGQAVDQPPDLEVGAGHVCRRSSPSGAAVDSFVRERAVPGRDFVGRGVSLVPSG